MADKVGNDTAHTYLDFWEDISQLSNNVDHPGWAHEETALTKLGAFIHPDADAGGAIWSLNGNEDAIGMQASKDKKTLDFYLVDYDAYNSAAGGRFEVGKHGNLTFSTTPIIDISDYSNDKPKYYVTHAKDKVKAYFKDGGKPDKKLFQPEAVDKIIETLTHKYINHKPKNALVALVVKHIEEMDPSPKLNPDYASAIKKYIKLAGQLDKADGDKIIAAIENKPKVLGKKYNDHFKEKKLSLMPDSVKEVFELEQLITKLIEIGKSNKRDGALNILKNSKESEKYFKRDLSEVLSLYEDSLNIKDLDIGKDDLGLDIKSYKKLVEKLHKQRKKLTTDAIMELNNKLIQFNSSDSRDKIDSLEARKELENFMEEFIRRNKETIEEPKKDFDKLADGAFRDKKLERGEVTSFLDKNLVIKDYISDEEIEKEKTEKLEKKEKERIEKKKEKEKGTSSSTDTSTTVSSVDDTSEAKPHHKTKISLDVTGDDTFTTLTEILSITAEKGSAKAKSMVNEIMYAVNNLRPLGARGESLLKEMLKEFDHEPSEVPSFIKELNEAIKDAAESHDIKEDGLYDFIEESDYDTDELSEPLKKTYEDGKRYVSAREELLDSYNGKAIDGRDVSLTAREKESGVILEARKEALKEKYGIDLDEITKNSGLEPSSRDGMSFMMKLMQIFNEILNGVAPKDVINKFKFDQPTQQEIARNKHILNAFNPVSYGSFTNMTGSKSVSNITRQIYAVTKNKIYSTGYENAFLDFFNGHGHTNRDGSRKLALDGSGRPIFIQSQNMSAQVMASDPLDYSVPGRGSSHIQKLFASSLMGKAGHFRIGQFLESGSAHSSRAIAEDIYYQLRSNKALASSLANSGLYQRDEDGKFIGYTTYKEVDQATFRDQLFVDHGIEFDDDQNIDLSSMNGALKEMLMEFLGYEDEDKLAKYLENSKFVTFYEDADKKPTIDINKFAQAFYPKYKAIIANRNKNIALRPEKRDLKAQEYDKKFDKLLDSHPNLVVKESGNKEPISIEMIEQEVVAFTNNLQFYLDTYDGKLDPTRRILVDDEQGRKTDEFFQEMLANTRGLGRNNISRQRYQDLYSRNPRIMDLNGRYIN